MESYLLNYQRNLIEVVKVALLKLGLLLPVNVSTTLPATSTRFLACTPGLVYLISKFPISVPKESEVTGYLVILFLLFVHGYHFLLIC